MPSDSFQAPAQPSGPLNGGRFRTTTFRVVVAVIICLVAVLFFRFVPSALRWPVRVAAAASVLWLVLAAWRAVRGMKFDGKKFVFSLILGGLLYGMLALVCHVFIKIMSLRDDRLTERGGNALVGDARLRLQNLLDGKGFYAFDREIGWVARPSAHSELYNTNSLGVRGKKEYPATPPDVEKRLLCLGDSFTFGFGVHDNETWPSHGEQLKPGTEWINLGISGTCLTQSLMQYRKTGKKLGGKYVVIAFMTNDNQRTVNCFRPIVSPSDDGHPFTKPFAKYAGGKFSLEPNPYQDMADYKRLLADEAGEFKRLRAIDYLGWCGQKQKTSNSVVRTFSYAGEVLQVEESLNSLFVRSGQKPGGKAKSGADAYGSALWNPEAPGFKALIHLFDLYHDEVVADGRIPLIVIIPGPLDVEDYKKGTKRRYFRLLDHFKAKGWPCLDFLDPLVTVNKADLSERALFVQAHYQSHINKQLAGEVINALHLP